MVDDSDLISDEVSSPPTDTSRVGDPVTMSTVESESSSESLPECLPDSLLDSSSSGSSESDSTCDSTPTSPSDSFAATSEDSSSSRPEAPAAEGSETAPLPDVPPVDKLQLCEQRIGYEFRDKGLLRWALTHASGAEHRLASNERLEFLGDAVLGLVICEALFHRFPQFLEGELTRVKSVVVSRQTCAKISTLLGLDECLILGKGMSSVPTVPMSLMADVFESLIAAVYLDGGLPVAADFVRKYLGPEIVAAASDAHSDNYKSILQTVAQRRFGATPSYHLLDERGPDHSKCFKMFARAAGDDYPPAWGRNKKEAEQRAACNALAALNGEPPPFPAD